MGVRVGWLLFLPVYGAPPLSLKRAAETPNTALEISQVPIFHGPGSSVTGYKVWQWNPGRAGVTGRRAPDPVQLSFKLRGKHFVDWLQREIPDWRERAEKKAVLASEKKTFASSTSLDANALAKSLKPKDSEKLLEQV